MWTDSTGKRSVSTASGHSEAAYAPTPPLPLLNWRHEVAHPLPPRPLRPRPERGLRLGGCRDGACRPSPYPPGTGRNPHQRLQNGPHPPTSGDWGSREFITVLGSQLPSSAHGKEAFMVSWTLIPATSSPPSGGESRLRCFGTRREHFSPSGREVFLGIGVLFASPSCQSLSHPNQCAATENATHLCSLHPNRLRRSNEETGIEPGHL